LINSSGAVTLPAISPDGQMLACQSIEAPRDLFALNLGGSILNQITDDDSNEMAPTWSPDGRRIAYYSNKSGAYQIWMVNRDGSGARQITDATEPGGLVLPIWSPDGSRMAFSLFGGKTLIMDLRKPWNEQTPVETGWIDVSEKLTSLQARGRPMANTSLVQDMVPHDIEACSRTLLKLKPTKWFRRSG
jgi:Tol biopolymer transport system component